MRRRPRPDSYDRLLGGAKAEFVFTDPPYNVPIDGHVCGLGRIRHRNFAMGCGEMSEAEFTGFLTTIFTQLVAAHASTARSIRSAWTGGTCREMLAAGHAVYSELKNLCVWNKSNAGMGIVLPLQARAGVRLEERHRAPHQHLRARPIRAIPIERLGLCGREQPQAGPAR